MERCSIAFLEIIILYVLVRFIYFRKHIHYMEERNLSVIRTLVQIADRFGHTSAMMTREETLEAVAENEGAWVFNGNGQMVQPVELAEADWNTIGTVRIVPGLVGGL